MNMRPAICQMYWRFISKSETFMYFYLTRFQRTQPIGISWKRFTNRDLFPVDNCPMHSLEETYHQWPFPTVALRSFVTRKQIWEQVNVSRCRRILSARGARLIHAHYGYTGYHALSVRKELGVPLITTFYGADTMPDDDQSNGASNYRARLFAEGDLFLVEGPAMKERLADLGCPQEKIQIQRIALRLKDMPFSDKRPRSRRKPAFLFAGRFVEKKGLIYALQAVRALARDNRQFEFRIVGDGPLNAELRSFVEENRLESHVRFLGFLNHAQYLDQVRAADVFVHPSVLAANGDNEGGAPTTILEAQAYGLPIIATTHADIPNITRPGHSSLLAPERDSNALASNMALLLDHPERWTEMGRAGRKFVEEYHDVDREIQLLEDRYLSLIGSH